MPNKLPKYATLPIGSLWPFTSIDKEQLLEGCSNTYTVVTKQSTSEVAWTSPTGSGGSFAIPHRYNELLKRFIWRGDILTALLRSPTYIAKINNRHIETAMVNNLAYHLEVFKELRTTLRAAAASKETEPTVRLLEVYMLEEFYVGRHDPAAVVKWQMTHGDINLRCSNVFNVDWKDHRVRFGPAWDGVRVRWSVARIKAMDDYIFGARKAYEDWYDHPYTMMERWDTDEEERVYAGDILSDFPEDRIGTAKDVGEDGDEDDDDDDDEDAEGELE